MKREQFCGVLLSGVLSVSAVSCLPHLKPLGPLQLLPLATSGAVKPASGILYVANTGDNTVSFLKATTGASLGTFPTGLSPGGIAVNAPANILYVANTGDNTVSFLDATTGASLGTFPTGNAPFGLAVNPTENMLYVGNNGDSTVTFLNARTGALLGAFSTGNFPTGSHPNGIAVNPAANILYVHNFNDGSSQGTVTFFDATTGAYLNGSLATSNFPTGFLPAGMVVDSAVNTLYVLDWEPNPSPPPPYFAQTGVTRLDAGGVNAGAYKGGSLSASRFPATGWTGPNPFRICIHPTTGMLYITNFYAVSANSLMFMDSMGTNIGLFTTDSYPMAMAVNAAATPNGILYVTNKVTFGATGPGTVTFFDATTGAYLIGGSLTSSTFATGRDPQGVAVAP